MLFYSPEQLPNKISIFQIKASLQSYKTSVKSDVGKTRTVT